MNNRTFSLSILLIVVMMVFTACSVRVPGLPGAGSTPTASLRLDATQPAVVVPSGAGADLLAAYQGTLESLYVDVSQSVVNIRTVREVSSADASVPQVPGFPFFEIPREGPDRPQRQFQSALGSGFVWDARGNIITNNHVIDGADKIEVTFSDGTVVDAELVGADPDSDLAVIHVDARTSLLKPVVMADSTAVKVGQLAVAIGNPFGLEGTMTTGIVSALGRSLPADQNSGATYSIPDVIQTDAPINPGNSGGVLVDVQGRVIGVTSAIESPVRANAGIGFAIPAAIVQNVVPALIEQGRYEHAWIGISGISLVPDIATAMRLDPDQRGALVEEVLPNSPARNANLRASTDEVTIEGRTVQVGGDVIISIEGQPVRGMDDLIAYLASGTSVGQKVTLTVLRDGREEKIQLTLAARPSVEARNTQEAARGVRLGIAGTTVNEDIASAMNLKTSQSGVLVLEVQPGSLAETAGLRAGTRSLTLNGQRLMVGGDIIIALNGQTVESIEELRAGLAQLQSDQELSLTLLRDGKQVAVSVAPAE